MTDAPESLSPTLCRLQVAAALRRHRRNAGFSAAEVTARLAISASKLSRIETGNRPVQLSDLEQLCALYEVADLEREHLRRLALESRGHSEFTRLAGSRTSWVPYAELEQAAHRINDYKTSTITALLQTPEYTQALLRALRPNAPDDVIEEQVHVRRVRQQHTVLSGAGPIELAFLVDEAALRRPIGGRSTMRAQLDRLIELSELRHVSFRVIPFAIGAHLGMDSLFTILSFSERVRDRVYVDGLWGDSFLTTAADLERYRDAFSQLTRAALDSSKSRSLLAEISEEL